MIVRPGETYFCKVNIEKLEGVNTPKISKRIFFVNKIQTDKTTSVFSKTICCCFQVLHVSNALFKQKVLRLLTGVILRVVAVVLVFIGVDVAFSGMFSGSESVSSDALASACFLVTGAISFNISFWFSARILVRSDIISLPREDLISSRFSVSILGDLLVPATGFRFWLASGIGVSISVETNSSVAFLFWLLVVIFQSSRTRSSENI